MAWNQCFVAAFPGRNEEIFIMRVLIGIILGAALTVGGAYLYDSHTTFGAANLPASAQRPMVNWDVVGTNWNRLTERARAEWNRIAS
jgi:hypothetical protein